MEIQDGCFPFTEYFKARMAGANLEEAMAAAGATKVEVEPNVEDGGDGGLIDWTRTQFTKQVVVNQTRKAAMDGLLTFTRSPAKGDDLKSHVSDAVAERLDRALDARFDLGEDWVSVFLEDADLDTSEFAIIVNGAENARATYDALVDAFESTKAQYQ